MTLEHLKGLRDDFSDEIPGKVLRGEGKFKARRNWWQGVIGDLEILKTGGQIPRELEGKVEEFLSHYTSEEFHQQSLTTGANLTRANNLLDEILGRNKTCYE